MTEKGTGVFIPSPDSEMYIISVIPAQAGIQPLHGVPIGNVRLVNLDPQ